MHHDTAVSVIGLGKLGAPMAGAFAARGFHTVGVDLNPAAVAAVRDGRPPVSEPGLAELLRRAHDNLDATVDTREAVLKTQITFVVVPTPSEPDGRFSLRLVLPACRAIGDALASRSGYHLVVLTSTVMPGSTAGPVRETLELASGKVCGRDFGLCYSPEFIALGSVIRDFLNPDFLLIGEHDARAGDELESVYAATCENGAPAARMSLVNAELTKLALNTFVTTKITYANMLAHLCERLPGGDVDVVTRAVGLDRRVGPAYLKGAVAYGGPCFPRDNQALAALARELGVRAPLAEVTDRTNRAEAKRIAELVGRLVPGPATIGVLGLTYKPDTDVIEESQGIALAAALRDLGYEVTAFDPALSAVVPAALPGGVTLADSLRACSAASDVLILMTPWPQFRELPGVLLAAPRVRVVVDCWRMIDEGALPGGVRRVALGIGPDTAPHSETTAGQEEPDHG